jgi:hypothetical protein
MHAGDGGIVFDRSTGPPRSPAGSFSPPPVEGRWIPQRVQGEKKPRMVRGRSLEVGSPVKIKSEASVNGVDGSNGADAMEVEVEVNKGQAQGTGEAQEASAARGKRAAEPGEGGKEAKRGINYGLRTSAVHALMTECSAVACGNYTSDPLSSCTADVHLVQDHSSATITPAPAPGSGSHPDPSATPAPAPLTVWLRLLLTHL